MNKSLGFFFKSFPPLFRSHCSTREYIGWVAWGSPTAVCDLGSSIFLLPGCLDLWGSLWCRRLHRSTIQGTGTTYDVMDSFCKLSLNRKHGKEILLLPSIGRLLREIASLTLDVRLSLSPIDWSEEQPHMSPWSASWAIVLYPCPHQAWWLVS